MIKAAIFGMYSRCQQISTTPWRRKTCSNNLSTANLGKSALMLIASFSAIGVMVSIGRLLPLRFMNFDV